MVDDDSSQVHIQLALTLGEMADDPRAIDAMAALGTRYADDQWFRLALASAPPAAASRILTNLLRSRKDFFNPPSDGKANLLGDLSRVVGARRDVGAIASWLAALSANKLLAEPTWRAAALKGLAEGLKLEGRIEKTPSSVERAVAGMLASSDPAVQDAAAEVAQYFSLPGLVEKAVSDSSNESLEPDARVSALYILRGAPYASAEPVLRSILTTASPGDLQQAAASTAASFSDASVAQLLLASWQGYGPKVRTVVADALLARSARAQALLDAIESGDVALQSLDAVTRIKLTQYPDEHVKQRAQQLFESEESDRAAILAEHQDVIELPSEPDRGKVVFERECAKCHMPRGERSRVGPNLSGVNNRGKETLLSHILEPSGAIEARYTNYILVTRDGYVHDGMLAGETPGTVTLRGELQDVTVLRENIQELRASTVSLMPDGLEETMTRQELADVIAYLRAGL